jgi:hypothetical protein
MSLKELRRRVGGRILTRLFGWGCRLIGARVWACGLWFGKFERYSARLFWPDGTTDIAPLIAQLAIVAQQHPGMAEALDRAWEAVLEAREREAGLHRPSVHLPPEPAGESAGERLNHLALERMGEHPEMTFGEAFRQVCAENPALAADYLEEVS